MTSWRSSSPSTSWPCFFAVDFFAVAFVAGAFLAAVLLAVLFAVFFAAGAFLAVLLAVLVAVFLAAGAFFAAVFFVVDAFLAVDFVAADFFAAAFAGAFFAVDFAAVVFVRRRRLLRRHRALRRRERQLRQLLRAGDDRLEVRPRVELGDRRLLGLDPLAGAGVAHPACLAHSLLEGSESGDRDLLALRDLARDGVEHGLQCVCCLLAVALVASGKRVDQLRLVHEFPFRMNPAGQPARRNTSHARHRRAGPTTAPRTFLEVNQRESRRLTNANRRKWRPSGQRVAGFQLGRRAS